MPTKKSKKFFYIKTFFNVSIILTVTIIIISFVFHSKVPGENIGAFDIDSKCRNGRLALIYKTQDSKPQIWF